MSFKTQVCLHPEAWKVQEASKRRDQTYTPHSIHSGTEHWKPSWPCSPVSVSQALQPRLVRWASVPEEDQLESRLKCHISSPEITPSAPRPQEGGERNPDRRWAGCPRGAWGTALWAGGTGSRQSHDKHNAALWSLTPLMGPGRGRKQIPCAD